MVRAWLAYVLVWLMFAVLWALAGATSAGRPSIEALPYGLLAMGSAALMGVGVWRLTGTIAADWRSPRFYVIHAAALALFCAIYATSWIWLDLVRGRVAQALGELRDSPVLPWNLLMGGWLYLMIAGIAYAMRAHTKLRAQEAAAADARLLAEQAQLAALRAQVNPHFLFNALHSVGALVATDPARADRALEQLGDLLRYALRSGDRVRLADEWRFTLDYLAFEQLRLGDRLTVDAVWDPDAGDVPVPPLVLQPLVENAVRHGIADRSDGGRIAIRVRRDAGRILLEVADDGPGSSARQGAGVGLESVRRRLSAIYGPGARVVIHQPGGGFAVTVEVPADRSAPHESAA